jgi:hypothetical protein
MYVGRTGQRLYASDLMASGIATHYVPKDSLADLERSMGSVASSAEVERVLSSHSSATPPVTDKALIGKHAEAISRCFAPGLRLQGIFAQLQAEKESGASTRRSPL